jgi:hypothetical protein
MISLPDTTESIVLRLATDVDAPTVRRLAALDDAPRLSGPVLLALVDGEPVAALALDDGRVVADPFRLTAHAVALLRLHAPHLTPPAPERSPWGFGRRQATHRLNVRVAA